MQAADLSGLPALADDSGLCVDALGGDPGIFSARWAGEAKDFDLAMRLVEDALQARRPTRRATRISSARWRSPGPTGMSNGSRAASTARWSGRRAGPNGFGYDPMFLPDGHDRTFGEMDPAQKHASATAPTRSGSWSRRSFNAPTPADTRVDRWTDDRWSASQRSAASIARNTRSRRVEQGAFGLRLVQLAADDHRDMAPDQRHRVRHDPGEQIGDILGLHRKIEQFDDRIEIGAGRARLGTLRVQRRAQRGHHRGRPEARRR